jgi:hypothetical protein
LDHCRKASGRHGDLKELLIPGLASATLTEKTALRKDAPITQVWVKDLKAFP